MVERLFCQQGVLRAVEMKHRVPVCCLVSCVVPDPYGLGSCTWCKTSKVLSRGLGGRAWAISRWTTLQATHTSVVWPAWLWVHYL